MATIKFPSEMPSAADVGGNDKLMISKDGSGEAFQVSFNDVKQYLDITDIELDPVQGGSSSGSATVIPNGPASQNRKMDASPGWYSVDSVPVEAAEGYIWKWFWNGTSWSLVDMGELPKVERVDVISPNGDGIPTEKAVADYSPKKVDTSMVSWGIIDEDSNSPLFIDKDLRAHLELHPDSYPQKQREVVGFDFAIADEQGNIVMGVDDRGDIFPKLKFDNNNRQYDNPKKTIRASDITQASDVISDGMWNQWIEPYAAVDVEGSLWIASVGHTGNLYITKRQNNGLTRKIKIGDILQQTSQYTTDDHNCPAVLLDNRPDAEYPIMVFQCDHNTHPLRYWKFDSLDINTFQPDEGTVVNTQQVGYTQVFRYGNEIFVFSRLPALPRPWRIAHSTDNGETWTSRVVFSSSASWLYLLCRLKDDGSGLNIACHGHPLNSTDQNIYFMQLDFESGRLTGDAGVNIIQDIRLSIANPSFVPVDPFEKALPVYVAKPEEITRLWDISRNSVGEVSIVFNVMPNRSSNIDNFKNSTYNVATVDVNTGYVSEAINIGEAGTPIENPKGANFYFAGAALIDNSKVLVSKWESFSQSDEKDDIHDDYGMSTVDVVDFSNPLSIKKQQVCFSDKKVIRPFVAQNQSMLIECNYFENYNDFYSNILINDLSNLYK